MLGQLYPDQPDKPFRQRDIRRDRRTPVRRFGILPPLFRLKQLLQCAQHKRLSGIEPRFDQRKPQYQTAQCRHCDAKAGEHIGIVPTHHPPQTH